MTEARYALAFARTARQQLAERLPAAVASAALEFITGALRDNPHRVGKQQLRPPLDDRHSARRGTYRVLYRIDDELRRVTVLAVVARADAYRSP